MTVRELIEDLKQYPSEIEVLLAGDEEGNRFHLLTSTAKEWEDEDHELIHEDDAEAYGDDEKTEVVVLWP